VVSWLSNIAFIIAQIAVIFPTRSTARGLIYAMVIILISEYLQLFFWLQTTQVGRFISAMVTIINKDIKGFMVVLVVIHLAFTACFHILMAKTKTVERWPAISWIIYELSVGTGEFFKEEMASILKESEDGYLKTLIYLTYIAYISLMLLVIMNLVIAVMSETTDNISLEMKSREKLLKLSSISLIARRLSAARVLTCNLCLCKQNYTIGGETGEEVKLFGLNNMNHSKDLKEYYNKMYYFCALEEESIEIEKDGKALREEKSKEDEMLEILRSMKSDKDRKAPMEDGRLEMLQSINEKIDTIRVE